jgi:hypothetical protein
MSKALRSWLVGLTFSLVTFIASPAFAKSISFKDAGIALWIFVIIGAVIVLLQLIPAIILFFSFIGTTTGLVAKRKRAMEELPAEEKGKVLIPGYEPEPVKK